MRRLFKSEFDSLTPGNEMKWVRIHPRPNKFRWGESERMLRFAKTRDKSFRAHTLVWNWQLPEWVWGRDPRFMQFSHYKKAWNAKSMRKALQYHVRKIVKHFKGRVRVWDVVNEAIEEDGSFKDSIFFHAMGREYVDVAFRQAHKADPQAQLFYNDYGLEVWGIKAQGVYQMLKSMIERGVPVHGVGLQAHLSLQYHAPTFEQLVFTLRQYASLGLKVEITELDVKIDDPSLTPEAALAKQAELYARVGAACRWVRACERVTVWGISDRYSWLGSDLKPLPFDTQFQPKPAWSALTSSLGR